jgi:hypothetical protein
MKRFFFDVSSTTRRQLDFRGREFAGPEQARELAELIALDLECSDDGSWAGSEVQVRNVIGVCLFTIPIRASETMAA